MLPVNNEQSVNARAIRNQEATKYIFTKTPFFDIPDINKHIEKENAAANT